MLLALILKMSDHFGKNKSSRNILKKSKFRNKLTMPIIFLFMKEQNKSFDCKTLKKQYKSQFISLTKDGNKGTRNEEKVLI